jgi:hypothetical protein
LALGKCTVSAQGKHRDMKTPRNVDKKDTTALHVII